MRITRSRIRSILKEVIDQFQVEYVGWENQYDQTEWTIKINGEEITAWTSGSPYDAASEAEYIAENATGEWFEDDDDHPAEEKIIIDALLKNPQFVSDVGSDRDAVDAYTDSMYADEW